MSEEDVIKNNTVSNALEEIAFIEGVKSWKEKDGEKTALFCSELEPSNRAIEIDFYDVNVTDGNTFADYQGNSVIMRNNKEFEQIYNIGDEVYINQLAYKIIGFTDSVGNGNAPFLFFPESKINEVEYSVSSTTGIYELTVENGYQISDVKTLVLEVLNKSLDNQNAKFIDFSSETSKALEEAMNSITTFLVLIAAVSLIVAAINVVNIMYITALEKKHEIAIFRALGMKKSTVIAQFLLQSSIIVIAFSMIGYLIGLFISAFILVFLNIKFCVPIWSIFITMILGLLVGIFSGISPALKAAEVSPAILLK